MKKQTAVEKIITEINNELQTLESLHGSEIMGRKIGLAFAKRVAEQAKAIEKEQSIHKLFVGFQEWHKNEYGSKYVEIDQFNEYLETYKRIKTD